MPVIDSPATVLLLWSALAYLLGSIPSGVLLARAMGLGDLRQIGSGNIGATNVLRTGNKRAAVLTLVFDALKGVVAVLLAHAAAGEEAAQLAAFFALVGHCFPVWLKFRGGKGVATYLGVMLALAWPVGLMLCAIWLATAFVTRYSSLSALVAAVLAPVVLAATGYGAMVVLAIALAAIVIVRHAANIRRLLAGRESKIGQKG